MSNDIYEDIVNSGSTEQADLEDAILKPLLHELNQIQSDAIRSFTRSVLLKADTFWVVPSSFSGRYHPPDEHSAGGNLLHTKRVFRVVKLLADSQERDPIECDMMFSAVLLHDITKGTLWSDGTIAYDPLHPITAERFVEKVRETDMLAGTESNSTTLHLEDEIVFQIMRMVRCSHGPWSPIPELIPITQMEWNVHYADYISSNLHLVTDEEVNHARWGTTETEPGEGS